MKVLFWVQHLLGIGHVTRARVLSDALVDAGFQVTIAFGGVPVDTIGFRSKVRYLAPIRAVDQTFSKLVTASGHGPGKALARRVEDLAAIGRDERPDIVLLEAWPFGRRPFTEEILALLAAAPRAHVAVSVRDILQTGRKPGRAEETADLLDRHVDRVLVHGDERAARLHDTFPLADRLRIPVDHTGYVAPARSVRVAAQHDVVVTAGGGAFGGPLMRAAQDAAERLPQRHWLLSTGPNLPKSAMPAPTDNLDVVPYLSPLADHLAGARVSVSQAGYNTVADVLRTAAFGTRAVFVPSDVTGQTEQLTRARRLEAGGLGICLPESELTPARLARAVEEAPAPAAQNLRFDGAARSAAILRAVFA